MINVFDNLKKIFQASFVQKSKESCPHCRVDEESLKVLKEKGEEEEHKEQNRR